MTPFPLAARLPSVFPGAELAVIALAFAWGGMLGSFVNVVLHRIPRGESVITGRSRCPGCGAGIRPRDNIPVLGWLLLRGRCRDCNAAISSRYPLVEAACGGMAALLATAELAGSTSLRAAPGRPAIDRLLAGDWTIVAAWAVRTVVPITVLAWGLLQFDGGASRGDPRRPGDRPAGCPGAGWIIAGVLALMATMPSIGPPWPWADDSAPGGVPRWLASALASWFGVVAGMAAGTLLGRPGDSCSLALCGAAAGWQTVLVASVVTAVVRCLAAVAGRTPRAGGLSRLAAATCLPAITAILLAAGATMHRGWSTGWRAAAETLRSIRGP